jgi:PhnB protein
VGEGKKEVETDGKTGSSTRQIKFTNMQLIPYMIFNGNCEQALKFYEKVLGGTIGQVNRYSDMPPGTPSMGMTGDKIMHTDFKVDGNVLFLASDGPSKDKIQEW